MIASIFFPVLDLGFAKISSYTLNASSHFPILEKNRAFEKSASRIWSGQMSSALKVKQKIYLHLAS